jgi:transglutaminase-like putative cysteine protease
LRPRERALPVRYVSCRLEFQLDEPSVLAMQVAAAGQPGDVTDERLFVTSNGVIADDTPEFPTTSGGRTHVVHAEPGALEVQYFATIITRSAVELPAAEPATSPVYDDQTVSALRQSRYCPSDALAGYAAVEFAEVRHGPRLPQAIASWVFERMAYEAGASGPLDTAIDTLVANAGVCRDFAHLTISLCRALGVPARLVAVYAPGLSPMDFHAVVEIRTGEVWEVLDPTRLAPRASLVRIATGRDAADTAFATTLRGDAELISSEVSAVVDGDLPDDDHEARIALQ